MVKHFPTQNIQLRGKLRILARETRQAPTPAENFLWQRLRNRQLDGFKFHRQYSIDRFIVDFYCASAGLVIEVDGEIHQQQVEADQERDLILNELGFRVLRFSNTQVIEQTDHVLRQVLEALFFSQKTAPKGTPNSCSAFS